MRRIFQERSSNGHTMPGHKQSRNFDFGGVFRIRMKIFPDRIELKQQYRRVQIEKQRPGIPDDGCEFGKGQGFPSRSTKDSKKQQQQQQAIIRF